MKKNLLKLAATLFFIVISVQAFAQRPNNYSYPTSPVTATYGTAVTITPNRGGGNAATSFSINPTPALPAGLIFNTTTGVISGTPTVVAAQATYTVTPTNASGNGNTFTVKITVAKANLTISANDVTKTYGTAITSPGAGSTAFTTTGLVAGDAVSSVSIAYGTGSTATSNAGTYTTQVTPSAAVGTNLGNYNIFYTKGSIIVNQATLTVTANNQSRAYGTNNPTFTLTYSGFVNGETTAVLNTAPTGSTTATTSSGVGTYPINVSGGSDNNYTFSYVAGTLTITQANLIITANNSNKTYGTALANPTSSSSAFTATGLRTGESITVTLAYSAGAAATDPAGTTGTITPSAATGGGTFNTNNYNITYNTGTLTVTTANLTISANNVSHAYGTTITSPGIGSTAFTSTGLKNGESIGSATITYGTGASATSGAGTYNNQVGIASATGGTFNSANYSIIYDAGNITVTQVNMTITATGPVRNYGDAASNNITYYTTNFTYSGTVNGETVTSVFFTILGTGNSSTAAAGTTYTVYPSDAFGLAPPLGGNGFNANNYNITYVQYNGTVGKAPLTITANNVTKTYGATLTNPTTGSTAFTSSGLKNGQNIGSVTISYTTGSAATDAVGAYTGAVVPSAATGGTFNANNYNISYVNGNITVNQANLTITATSVTKPYGTTLTTGPSSTGFTTSGLVNSESINTVYLTYSAGNNATDTIGTTGAITASLPVTGSGTFNIGNYNITFVPGVITVGAATFDWIGAVSSDWATPGNWSVNGIQQTTVYPGMNEATDVVHIGYIAYTNSANQPTISANLPNSIATLTFGSATTPITLNLASNIALNVSGTTTLNAGSEVVNLNGASGSSLVIGGDYVNNTGATFNNNSSATITISGVFTNTGTNNFGSALLTFNNTGNPVIFTTTGTQVFTNVVFANGHYLLKKPGGPGSAQFNIASNGTLTLTGGVNLTIASATLTLLSDATGSASVAPITDNSTVNGTVSVQRYMQANRGYRLMASPVNAGTDANGNYVYSINYLKNSVYLTGTTGTAGLFDKAGNPTLYFYREDITPIGTSFLTTGYRGVSSLTTGTDTPPTYPLNLEASNYSIPVSNGYLFYYRGSRNQKTLTQLTTVGAPATTDTLTTSGTLNIGQIVFRSWYTPSSTALSYSNPDPSLAGFNLAGNPYASSIDWETYNTATTTSGIYAQNISDFVYEFNPLTNNYDVYEAGQGGTVFTNNATRTIVSGQGFFVLAKGAGAQLIFNESAKNTAQQNTGPNLYMGKPNEMAVNNQFLKLQIAADAINKDDIVIAFNNSAKSSFDITEDAPYKTGSGKVSLASFSSDKKLLAINRMPLNAKAVTVPLKIGATAQGTYSLNMNSVQGVPMLYDIWLMDAYKKDSVDMRHNKSYLFDVSFADTNTYGAHRFTLIMRQNPALAYHLLNFTATKATGRQVQVNWVTENEANYTNFTVERSTDNGNTYEIIGNVQATGAGAYGLLDKDPGENNLYRLKQEDYNNIITYSHIIPVGFANQSNNLVGNNINIYPNPAASTVSMAVNSAVNDKATTYNFTITNTYGLVIKQGSSAQASWETNVSDLLPGTYVIQVINNKDKSFVGKSKLIKL
ncbi:MAG: hypothetical protein JST50_08710 [Bacteroidetes bacterium]|nr:hypothetical protein [Bacteroidota bacterium]